MQDIVFLLISLTVCAISEPDACYRKDIVKSMEAGEKLTPWKCQHYGMVTAIEHLKEKNRVQSLRVTNVRCGRYREQA